MAHAEKCPICNGTGEIADENKGNIQCHGCFGRGWVEIHDDHRPLFLPDTKEEKSKHHFL